MIEAVSCPVNSSLLQKSNEIWNLLALNAPWSVGLTSYLIRQAHFNDFSAWRDSYFSSGDQRLLLLDKLQPDVKEVLLKSSLTHARLIWDDVSVYKHLTHRYGRSSSEFDYKAQILSQAYYAHTGEDLSLSNARALIEYRVLGETWNGIYIREVRTIAMLKNDFPQLKFEPISAELDYRFGVDYTVSMDNALICGLQIKPLSYDSSKSYVQKAKAANALKNQKFTAVYNKPVFTILCSQQGQIKRGKDRHQLYECLAGR